MVTKAYYVSYSSYDTINPHMGDAGTALHEALDILRQMDREQGAEDDMANRVP